jgi:hypothetical protein
MNKALFLSLVLFSFLLDPVRTVSAESVKFLLSGTVYTDQQNVALHIPEGVGCDDRSLVVADTGNGRLLKYAISEAGLSGEQIIKVSQLPYPIRVRKNPQGEILVLDGKNRRIVRLSPEGQFKELLDPKGIPAPSNYVPRSFAVDREGGIYILDIYGKRVLLLDEQGKYKSYVPLPKGAGFISDLAVNAQGDILLIDSVKAMVFGAAKGTKTFAPVTKSLKELVLFPVSMAVDKMGEVYLVDQNGGSIVLIGLDGTFQRRKLGMGSDEGLLYYPSQICISDSGAAFIADRNNNRVQVFQ